jgi:hypothetical protein
MFGLTGGHAEDAELAEEGQAKFEIVCRVVAEHLRWLRSPGGGRARLRAVVRGPWPCLPVLDGKADKTKISVDEDAYLRLAGNAYLSPVRTGG